MATGEIPGELSQGDALETLQQQGLRVRECVVERRIDGLLHEAFRSFSAVADREQGRFTQRLVQLAKVYSRQVPRNAPAAAAPAARRHESRAPQQAHRAPDDDRVRVHAHGKRFRGHRLLRFSHMEKRVENGRKPAVSSHVTNYVTLSNRCQAKGCTVSFSDPAAVAQYVDNLARLVPGVGALHQMTHVLLAEHVPAHGHVLVLGAGGGVELKAFAQSHAQWRFTGVDPSADMLALAAMTLGEFSRRVELIQGYIESAPEFEFDGATCLLTLHFLARDERLRTLRELRRRLKPGAPLVVAHHSVPADPGEKRLWFRRWGAFTAVNGVPRADAEARAETVADRLPTLSPCEEEDLLRVAGFAKPALFYAALTFRGWVAYA